MNEASNLANQLRLGVVIAGDLGRAANHIDRLCHALTVIAEAAEEFDGTVDAPAFAEQTAARARSALEGRT